MNQSNSSETIKFLEKHRFVQLSSITPDMDVWYPGYLELETYHELRGTTKVRIRGVATGRYICFNQKGRLVTKPCKRANDSGKFCEFKEVVGTNGYTKFISKENPEWKITFNKAGDPLRGMEKRRKFDLCSDFLKLRMPDSKHHHRHHHGEAPECVREDKNKYHHRKRKG